MPGKGGLAIGGMWGNDPGTREITPVISEKLAPINSVSRHFLITKFQKSSPTKPVERRIPKSRRIIPKTVEASHIRNCLWGKICSFDISNLRYAMSCDVAAVAAKPSQQPQGLRQNGKAFLSIATSRYEPNTFLQANNGMRHGKHFDLARA